MELQKKSELSVGRASFVISTGLVLLFPILTTRYLHEPL
jgi:hypothetical protein